MMKARRVRPHVHTRNKAWTPGRNGAVAIIAKGDVQVGKSSGGVVATPFVWIPSRVICL